MGSDETREILGGANTTNSRKSKLRPTTYVNKTLRKKRSLRQCYDQVKDKVCFTRCSIAAVLSCLYSYTYFLRNVRRLTQLPLPKLFQLSPPSLLLCLRSRYINSTFNLTRTPQAPSNPIPGRRNPMHVSCLPLINIYTHIYLLQLQRSSPSSSLFYFILNYPLFLHFLLITLYSHIQNHHHRHHE